MDIIDSKNTRFCSVSFLTRTGFTFIQFLPLSKCTHYFGVLGYNCVVKIKTELPRTLIGGRPKLSEH